MARRLLTVTVVACLALAVTGALGSCGSPAGAPDSADLSKYAWVVGGHGLIFATTDGGAHWRSQTSGTTSALFSVAFADPTHGWIACGQLAGEPASVERVLATTDGGAHWTPQPLDPTGGRAGGNLDAVACTNEAHVWVGGWGPDGRGLICASSDGGATWSQQNAPLGSRWVSGIAFADSSHGWAVTGGGRVLATTDGGAHWVLQHTPAAGSYMLEVTCPDALHCWVSGPTESPLVATTDGGASWHKVATPESFGGADAVWASDDDHIFLGGEGAVADAEATIFSSSDGGATWSVAVSPDRSVSGIAGSPSGTLWSSGIGAVVTSTDGGSSWSETQRGPVADFYGVACPRSATTSGR